MHNEVSVTTSHGHFTQVGTRDTSHITKYPQVQVWSYRQIKLMNQRFSEAGLPLLCHFCCFLVQRVSPTQRGDEGPSLVGMSAGTDPLAGSTLPEQTSLQEQMTQSSHDKLLHFKHLGMH